MIQLKESAGIDHFNPTRKICNECVQVCGCVCWHATVLLFRTCNMDYFI